MTADDQAAGWRKVRIQFRGYAVLRGRRMRTRGYVVTAVLFAAQPDTTKTETEGTP